MGLIDYSPWFQPIPESPMARGLDSLNKSVQAIIQRRQQQQQFELNQRNQMEQARMDDERTREIASGRLAQDQAELQQRQAAAQQQAKEHAARLEFDRQKQQGEAWQNAQKAYDTGAPEVGQQLLQTAGLTRKMDNIEDIPLEEMLNYDVAPTAPAGPTAQDMDEFERGAPMARQQEDAQTQALYDRFSQQGLIMPDGSAVPFNGPPTLALRARRAAEQLAQFKGRDPLIDEAVEFAPAAIETGMIEPDKSSAIITGARDQVEQNKRAQLAAAAAASRQRFEKPMSGAQAESAARNTMIAYLNQVGFKATKHDVDEARRLKSVAKGIKDGNWALTGVLSGMFSKLSQGGTGVLTNSDMQVFWSKLGSLKQKTFDGWSQWVEGKPTPEKLAELDKALEWLEMTGRTKLNEAHSGAAELMEEFGPDGDRWLRSLFGRGLPSFEKQRKAEALKAAAGKKK